MAQGGTGGGTRARPPLDAAGLLPYVPVVQLRWHATTPDRAWLEVPGTLVFADVSGFTPLTEKLARRGKVGAEELTDVLNQVFTGLLDAAGSFGGDLLKFGGDALLLLFEGERHAERATAAAEAMQRALRPYRRFATAGGTVSLRMSVGVESGPVTLLLAGGSHRELLVAGPTATAVAELEGAAEAGEVLVGPGAVADIGDRHFGDSRAGGRLLRSAPAAPAPGLPEPPPADPALGVPSGLRAHLLARHDEGEHRRAVLTFLQFKGTDDLLASEGPDAAADALDHLVRTFQEACEAHDVAFLASDVDKNGGKLLAAAGAPTAGPNDEDRMLLAMRAVTSSEQRLAIRVGVNRGRAFAVDMGAPHRRTYAVMGDATNLAARVMGRAEPGQIVATRAVLDRLTTEFDLAPLDPFHVKGKTAPVDAAVIGAPRGRRSAPARGGLPLVGRDDEVAVLLEAVEAAGRAEARTVELVGEPGIGKSALVAELRRLAGDLPVLTVEGAQYAAASPYFALRRPLRLLLGAGERDADDRIEEVLRRRVAADAPDLAGWIPFLAMPLGLELPDTETTADVDPEFRRLQLNRAVGSLMARVLPGPAVVVVEDGHWLDEASGDLVRHLVGSLGLPWAVCLTRRDVDGGLSLAELPGAHVIRLQPLGDEAVRALVAASAASSPLPGHLRTVVAERSGGNPLFLQELLAASAEGADLDNLPDTVEAVIAARIDTLEAADRAVLRQAAVLGGRFPETVLRDLVEDERQLEERLVGLGGFLQRSGGAVSFRHALLREVAYEGLPFRRRRVLHARAGELVERMAGEDTAEWSDLLSLHYWSAERWDPAWHYSLEAGDRARRNLAPADAAVFYRRAVDAARRLPQLPSAAAASAHERLGDVLELSGQYDAAQPAYRAARRLAGDDPLAVVHLVKKEGWLRERTGRYSQALRWYTRGLGLLDGIGADGDSDVERARAQLILASGVARLRQGRYTAGIPLLQEAVRRAEPLDDRPTLAHAYYLLDWALTDLGDPDAQRYRELALPIYEELGDLMRQANVLCNLGIDAYYEGRWDEALALYERSRSTHERAGNVIEVAVSSNNIGEVLSDQGHLAAAEDLFREALSVWRATSFPVGVNLATSNLGRAAARAGRFEEAAALLAEARAGFEEIKAETFVCEADAREAERRVLAGLGGAGDLATEVLERAERLGGLPVLIAMVERVAGYALAQEGRFDDALERLRSSLVRATSARADYERALTLDAVARVGRLVDDDAVASAAAQAEELFARLGVVEATVPPLPHGAVTPVPD